MLGLRKEVKAGIGKVSVGRRMEEGEESEGLGKQRKESEKS